MSGDPAPKEREPAVSRTHRVIGGREPDPTSGDNSVDSVDNSVTSSERVGFPEPTGTTLRGPDLARAALQAAREQAQSRRKPRARQPRRRRGWSGPRADDRDPQRFGSLLARIASDRGWSGRLAGGEVFGRWRSLVGEDVAEHTKPVALQDGELTVQAESTAWATQLRLLQRQILKRIADGVGRDVVRRIKVQGPAAPSWRYGPRHVPGRGPRDTYG